MAEKKIFKVLSRNDTGETHSHQSGISIPKKVISSGVLPPLGIDSLNPRITLTFFDCNQKKWEFPYIYYNDAFFGKEPSKSHNEYRITCVIDFLREFKVKSGDSIWFSIDDNGIRRIGIQKQQSEEEQKKVKKIVLCGGWHYFEYE